MALGFTRAGSTTVRLVADTGEFNRDIDRAERNFRGASTRMQGDLGKLSRGALAGSGAFRGMARSIAFASGAFLGGAGLTAVIRTSIGAASNLNEQINKINVVFRSSGTEVVRWSKTTAGSLGIARDEALETAGVFGNMLVPMGFARDRAAQMSVKLVKLAADMASFNNADPKEVLEALRAGLAGETEPLRRFGVFLSQARVEQEALNKHLWDGKGKIDAAAKAAATMSIIMKDTSDAQGDFQRTSGGLANQQRILHARLRDTEAMVGKALLPTVLNITKGVNDWLAKSKNQERIQRDLNSVIKTAGQIFGALRDIVKFMTPIVKGLTDVLGGTRHAFELLFALGVVAKLRGIAIALGLTNTAGLAGAATRANTRVGILSRSLKNLPSRIVVSLVVATAVYGPAKKFFEDKFGADYSGIQPDVQGTGGNPYPKGTISNQSWAAGYAGKQFVASGPNAMDRTAYLQGRSAKAGKGGSVAPATRPDDRAGVRGPDAGPGVQIGTGVASHSTHDTSGLAGFPAVDIMASPGTPVRTPEDCTLTRRHFINWNIQKRIGGWTCYLVGHQTGSTYFVTHLGTCGAEGHYRRGAVFGTVASVPGGAWAPHVHVGQHAGGTQVPSGPSSSAGPTGSSGGAAARPSPHQFPSRTPAPKKPSLGGFTQIGGSVGLGVAPVAAPVAKPGQKVINIPGIGKILVGTEQAPTLDQIRTTIVEIDRKLRAAISRRDAKAKALKKLLRVKRPNARQKTAINRLRRDIGTLNRLIADLKADLGEYIGAANDLAEEMKSQEEAAAGEQEAGGGGEGDHEKNTEMLNQGSVTDIPQGLSYQLAQGQFTGDVGLQQQALRAEDALLSARLDRTTNIDERIALMGAISGVRQNLASVATSFSPQLLLQQAQARLTPSGLDDRAVVQIMDDLVKARLKEAKTIEEQIALTNQLAELEDQLKNTRAQENQELVSYLTARRDLKRQFAGNLYSPSGMSGGAGITLYNYFGASPADPHLFSSQVAFDLGALVG